MSTETTAQPLPKRIICCCDGTWKVADAGKPGMPTNVARMATSIAKVGVKDKKQIPQIVSYHGGVGTGALGPIDRAYQAAFGAGVNEKVCEAYYFIAANYAPGDEIFLFGFSRGAFTARSVAGLICDIGLIKASSLSTLGDMYEAYQTKGNLKLSKTKWAQGKSPNDPTKTIWEEFKLHRTKEIPIKVVGVWDTVGSLGLPDSSWWTKAFNVNEKYKFHNTSLHPSIENAFHALALDEHRGNFPPTMWYLEPSNTKTKLKQCWFPGYHSDIGGGDPSGKFVDVIDVADITFAWMVDQISEFITMDPDALDAYFLSQISEHLDIHHCGPTVPKTTPGTAAVKKAFDWGTGKIVDLYSLAYWAAGGEYIRRPGDTTLYDQQNRPIPRERFYETVHPIVQHRAAKVPEYKPKPLAANNRTKTKWDFNDGSDGKGRRWVKLEGGKVVLSIDEYQVPKNETLHIGSLERQLAPKGVMEELDKAWAN